MILKRARVQNFRAIRDAEVHFGRHTAIIGGNGTGKSTILRAIEQFYAPSAKVEGDDFFGRRLDQQICITLTFMNFNADEQERFGDRIQNNEMTVTRIFEAGGGRNSGRYFGSTQQYGPFADIRALDGALPRRAAFNQIAPDLGLPPVANAAELDLAMTGWEQANLARCEQRTDDGAFFGFTNVARGNLQRSTSFVFIPAVRDASADSVDGRGAVVARLMELVVRSAVQRRADVRDFQTRVTGEFRDLVDPARLPELGGLADDLSSTLQDFYAEAGVALRWQPPEDFVIPLPKADVLLREDGFEGPVDRKGHGLQRAFIVTLLQHLALAGAANEALGPPADGDEDQVAGPFILPGLILAIEEPELYQHPTKQRHFAKVLRQLSDGTLPGVAAQTQVMFASHSPLFICLERFDEVRLARRFAPEGEAERACQLSSSSLTEVAHILEGAHAARVGSYTADILRGKLHIIGTEIAEGFFAEMVVLVEGKSDRAALFAQAALEGFDFEANGIAVLWVDGKNNLDRPAVIFSELGIPTYVIFDCDAAAGEQAASNRAIQRVCAETDIQDACLRVTEDYACFETELEGQLRLDLGAVTFDSVVAEVQAALGIKKDEVLKTPSAMTEALRLANDRGHRSDTLGQIIASIRNKRNRN